MKYPPVMAVAFRDHKTDPIPLNTRIVFVRQIDCNDVQTSIAWDIQRPSIFVAYLYDTDDDGFTNLKDYSHPEFDNRVGCSIEIRIVVAENDDDSVCSGYAFKRQRILWALWADVEPQIKAFAKYFGVRAPRKPRLTKKHLVRVDTI